MKKTTSSPHKIQCQETPAIDEQASRSPIRSQARQIAQPPDDDKVPFRCKTEPDQADSNIKLLSVHDRKDNKDCLGAIINEIISNVEECSEIRQSIRELRSSFNRNESQLKDLKNQVQDPQINLLQKTELTKKLENLIDVNKKNKEIDDQLRNKFKLNEQQLMGLKNVIIKMFEDQFACILRLEFKELHLKQENRALQMSNSSLSQENTKKATIIAKLNNQISELENMLGKNSQHTHNTQQKSEKSEEIPPTKAIYLKKQIEKFNPPIKIVSNFSTPKADTKLQGSAKTTEIKRMTANKKSFRLPKREFGKETSPSPQPTSAFSIKLTSPISCYQDRKIKPKSFVSSKQLWGHQSPNAVPPARATHYDPKVNSSISQIFPKSVGAINGVRSPTMRYSDVNDQSKNRPSIGKDNIKDFNNKSSLDYANSKQGKSKDLDKNSIFNFPSIDFDNDSASTFEVTGHSKEINPSDIQSVNISEENLQKQKVKVSSETSNYLGSKNGFSSKSLYSTLQLSQDSNINSIPQNNNQPAAEPETLGKPTPDDNSAPASRLSLRKNSVKMNLDENMNPNYPMEKLYTSTKKDKRKLSSFIELAPDHYPSSSNKKSPCKGRIRDITNLQFSSNRKGPAYHSKHDSLVKFEFETSVKKKTQRKIDSNQKSLNSDLKNPMIEVDDIKDSYADSPRLPGVNRNLSNLKQFH